MKTGSKERDLFLKLCRYCAYRERSISELREKMAMLEILPSLQEDLLLKLQEENFLNEKRFAASFVRGKFRNNSWGRNKIVFGLRSKGISKKDIDAGLKEIEEEDYLEKMKTLMHSKMRTVRLKNILARRKKVADFMQRKGYEIHLVWEILKQEFPD
ncbi:MAG: regulatory protein [Chitinophagales bacterium]|jgi:regulatory protein